MPKSETISTAAKPEDLDKAHASAVKALSTLGLKITLKKPDAAKLGPAMTKSKKKAEFKLTGDAKMVKVTVECDNMVNTLGILDVSAERDVDKYLTLLKNLENCGIASKSDYEKAKAEIEKAKGPDPKVAANRERRVAALKQEISKAEKNLAGYSSLKTYDAVEKFPPIMKELRAHAKSEMSDENFEFLDAVKSKMKVSDIKQRFLDEDSPRYVNLSSAHRKEALAGKLDNAAAAIKLLINTDTLARYTKTKTDPLNAQITKLKKELAAVEKA